MSVKPTRLWFSPGGRALMKFEDLLSLVDLIKDLKVRRCKEN